MKIYRPHNNHSLDKLVGSGLWVRVHATLVGIMPLEDNKYVPRFTNDIMLYWFCPRIVTTYNGQQVYIGKCTRSYVGRNEDYMRTDFMHVSDGTYQDLISDRDVHYIYAKDLEVLTPLEVATPEELFRYGD